MKNKLKLHQITNYCHCDVVVITKHGDRYMLDTSVINYHNHYIDKLEVVNNTLEIYIN